jgi:transketolase
MALAKSTSELKAIAKRLRVNIVKMIGAAGSGHPGGSLSQVELLTALYFGVMRHDPERPNWRDRDRFVLSKGHGCPALYAVLAEAGYIDPALLMTLRKLDSPLQGHPDKRFLPVLEASTGSLGNGLSIGVGIALAAKMDGRDHHTFVVLGDGEMQEGQIWEAAMFAGYHKLENLTAIVDYNKQQLDDWTAKIVDIEPVAEKLRAFNWDTIDIDGHDFDQVIAALDNARNKRSERPTAIVAHTVKGKGVSFMENNIKWHGVAPKPDEVEAALHELEMSA